MTNRLSWFVIIWMMLIFVFLYAPIVSVIVYSFNASKLVTVWGGFDTKWYGALANDRQIIDAAKLSLLIAAISSTFATIIGTVAGYVLVRFPKFLGRTAFSGMVNAPLVMPEVITGLSMLLLFISMEQIIGWPSGRGLTTVIIAHVTFTLCYVAVVTRSRFLTLDLSLEEAAQDLGAKPLKVFFVITLPIIAPAIVSGWLLGFTISLDNLVITSFTNGPGTTTLPQVVFSKVRLGLDPKINALATIIIAIVSVGVVIATIHMRRADRQRERDEQMAIRTIATQT
ncbi:MAG: ABC transporter permease subunit [Mesorhizobium sp.]|uniref:ABC transporter permease subunit n=1 Tax=Mesorhizobium sp. TaxID=1871066 RepID=UPI000FE5EB79|nr:ABC transporter permease subunit [Mesorhizobium sp.]RWJ39836.1 MAG: ABC transporter permease subunit [Mesorhizobium sp.]RWJ81437.1 MAG: ABC transporter permease subunit [Mesorhizobium sp.]TIR08823.1 MAG: ABC transporter permease subunit [Mesorhizobium sp.]